MLGILLLTIKLLIISLLALLVETILPPMLFNSGASLKSERHILVVLLSDAIAKQDHLLCCDEHVFALFFHLSNALLHGYF